MSAARFSAFVPALIIMAGTTAGQPAAPQSPSPDSSERATESPSRNVKEWNLSKGGLAIDGYDPVAYFTEGGGAAKAGDPKITTTYNGATYRFATEANRTAFLKDPGKYEPAHGGWCSWAMREGDKVEIDPKSFIVKNDRLFLFYKGWLGDTRAKWLKGDHTTEANEADTHWKKTSGESPRMAMRPAAPSAMQTAIDKSVAEVDALNLPKTALAEGAKVPTFTLPDAHGKPVSSADLLAKGPIVLTFYRGGWCPFCNAQLAEYQERLSDITSRGAQLVAVSPQTPDNSLSTTEKETLAFTVLSDMNNTMARQFGIVYTVPPSAEAMYRPILSKANGNDSNELPLAATYVIAGDGTIVYRFIDSDFRRRASVDDLVAALDRLNAKR